MLRLYIFLGLQLAVSAYALVRGGAPERIVAVLMLVAYAVSMLVQSQFPVRFHGVELGIFMVDCAMLAALLAVALRAERFWPLWMTGLQAVAVAAHLAKMASPEVIPWAYAAMLAFWSYPMMALLAIGTWRHWRRMAAFGADRSWSAFSPPSPADAPPGWPMR
ncbi:hypothetical protein [Sphingomonas gilva]|uniref:hypothetical protein n=1 Tax=Sphingomonas gilva TaxID=2305907 RepID=UPI0015FDA371|nr:hypothetical protein [Sphingomonas gilva]